MYKMQQNNSTGKIECLERDAGMAVVTQLEIYFIYYYLPGKNK